MADRILRWHIPGVLSETGVVDTDVHGNAYLMDRDYRVITTWMRVKRAPQGTGGLGIQVDINYQKPEEDEGTSIYGDGREPALPDNTLDTLCNTFSSQDLILEEESVITLDIDRVGEEYSGKDLVVELYLEAA